MRVGLGLLGCLLTASSATAIAGGDPVPHLARDILAGDAVHARTHFATDYRLTTYKGGRKVEIDVAEMVGDLRTCSFLRFGRTNFLLYRDEDLFIFNCGDDYDFALRTAGRTEGIIEAVFYAEAVAAPLPPPPSWGKN